MDVFIVKKLAILLNNVLINKVVDDKIEEDPVEIDMIMIDIAEEKNKEAGAEVITMENKDNKEDIENLDLGNTLPTTIEEESTEDKGTGAQNQDLIQALLMTVAIDVEVIYKYKFRLILKRLKKIKIKQRVQQAP